MRKIPNNVTRTLSSPSIRILRRASSGDGSSLASPTVVVPPHQQPQRRSSIQRRKSPKKSKASRAVLSTVLLVAIICCSAMCWSFVSKMKDKGRKAVTATPYDRQINDGAARRDLLPSRPEKEPILQLLRDAGVTELDQDTLDSLPTWAEVTKQAISSGSALYGEKPVMLGLDTCRAFQEASDPAEHYLAVAGTFNSGTNLLAELLIHNCHMPARMAKYGKIHEGIRWQVPWGKHTPVNDEEIRQGHKTTSGAEIPADNVFPAITVRDPAVWAESMCRHEYAIEWPHSKKDAADQHCPNFVPNDVDFSLDESLRNASSVSVLVKYAEFERKHDSLIDHWNDYYGGYFKQDRFPRLMVRFEDLIFHPRQVVQAVCECAGGALKHEHDGKGFQYIVQSAKKTEGHGKEKTGFVDAIVRYGTDKYRWKSGGMTDEDRRFVIEHLDRELMEQFGYQYPTGLTTVSLPVSAS